jgi:Uma2 family endonuclease
MQSQATKKRFTADEYYTMAEVGILACDARTELLDGEIIEVSAMGARHHAAVNRCNELLVPLFLGKAQISVQCPVRLNEFSEPEPDFAFLKPRRDFYELRHPGPTDVLLILEIADTFLHYDRDVKLTVYAAARIKEVWIGDLSNRTLLVFRDPSHKAYTTSFTLQAGEKVSPLFFPDIQISVSDLLGTPPE